MAKRAQRDWAPNVIRFMRTVRKRTYSHRELSILLNRERENLRIPKGVGVGKFITVLSEKGKLRVVEPVREVQTRAGVTLRPGFKRFVLGEPSAYEVALSFRAGSYLSHTTAVFLHELTEQMPKTVYVNKEQSPKPRAHQLLSQAGIDQAFSNLPRVSKYVFAWEGHKFVMLNGKHTGRLEVSQIEGPLGEVLDVTKLERTLIDIAVRPIYAGGVHEVAAAFRAAKDRISVNTLVATLKKLDYVYPYHQAIGFYMERSGYSENQLRKLRSMKMEYDFYLTNRIADKQYDQGWRLYYPKGL